jgi:hypothetical protein
VNVGANKRGDLSKLVLAAAGEMGLDIAPPKPRPSVQERAAELAAQDEWLARNAIECPHLKAKIKPEQCKALRTRPENGEATSGGTVAARPPQCSVCTCYPGFDPKKHAAEEKRRRNERMIGVGDCAACGRIDVERPGKGICRLCSSRFWSGGRLIQHEGQWVFRDMAAVHAQAVPENTLVFVAGRVRTLADLTEDEIEAARMEKPEQAKEDDMGKRGECAACHRSDMALPIWDICGTCYNRKREKRLKQDEQGRWVFKSLDDVPDDAIRPFDPAGTCKVLVQTPGGPLPADRLGEASAERALAQTALDMAGERGEAKPPQTQDKECAACHRTGLTLPGKGLCGFCYPRQRDESGRLVQDEGRWVFAADTDAPNGADYNRTMVRFEGGVTSLAVFYEERRKHPPNPDQAGQYETSPEPDPFPGFDTLLGTVGHDAPLNPEPCGSCGGTGVAAEDGDTCPECGGSRAQAAAEQQPEPGADAPENPMGTNQYNGITPPAIPGMEGVEWDMADWRQRHAITRRLMLSISKAGEIVLGRGLCEAMELTDPAVTYYCRLWKAKGQPSVAIQVLDASRAEEPGALRFTSKTKKEGRVVSNRVMGKAALLRWGVQFPKDSVQIDAKVHGKDMAVFELPAEMCAVVEREAA